MPITVENVRSIYILEVSDIPEDIKSSAVQNYEYYA